MVGWFDAVEKGNALRFGGFDWLVINKLDALMYRRFRSLKICVAYEDIDEIEQPLYQGPKAKV